jgi:UDP-GlcNAc:undecaprenyl-phosphate GlcNAc-1-phosphate transferase
VLAYFLIFFAALVLAIAVTPVARRVAVLSGVVAVPSSRRVHQKTTPLLGGVAIYLASGFALVLFSDRFYVPQLVGIFIGATLVSFLGLWDDRSALPPLVKLIGQAVAASLLLLTGIRVQIFASGAVDLALTLVWIVGVVNALNLLDNMDGLSGGVAAVASAFFLVLAVQSGQFLVGSLAAALLGACLGFLYYNFNPATIFMGDSGSLFLGYILAAVGLKLKFDNVDTVTWMVPVLILGVPIFDTTVVVISRLRRGESPLKGGKDHVSHRLVRLGWTHREAVMALYLVCGALGWLATLVAHATAMEAYTIGAIVCVVALMSLIKLESIRMEPSGEGSEPGSVELASHLPAPDP